MKKLIFALIAVLCFGVVDCYAVKKATKKRTGTAAAAKPASKGGKFTTYKLVYDPLVDNPVYDSDEPESEWNPRMIKTDCKAEVEWPESLDGCEDITPLQNYLMTQVLNANVNDGVEAALKAYLADERNMELGGPFGPGHGIEIKPGAHGTRWADILVSVWLYTGSGTGAGYMESEGCLLYDKTTGRIFKGDDIINTSSPELLRLLNRTIKAKRRDYSEATEVPDQVIPGATALTFVFPKYSISYGAEGNVKISVPYTKLMPYLKPDFKAVMGLR